ncbi:TetR/AcrR family transcriptional regulator, partial [Streptomyces panacea]|uniref:TetR/AcrR family transcriptional regulator n=1 Tax=Streptomyces panacea TaxID=3035064 RepID=UPI00339C9839
MSGSASVRLPDPRERLRLRISRAATRLFLTGGTATSGDRIVEEAGVSTRTIWRHFRNKESCAEPIGLRGLDWELNTLHGWPPGTPLEDHLTAEAAHFAPRPARPFPPVLQPFGPADPPHPTRTRAAHRLADGLRPRRTRTNRSARPPDGPARPHAPHPGERRGGRGGAAGPARAQKHGP